MNRPLCNLCALAFGLALLIFATHSADESQEGRNSCPLLYRFLPCLVSQNVLHVLISLAVYSLTNINTV